MSLVLHALKLTRRQQFNHPLATRFPHAARRTIAGDPGLLGFLGKAIGGIAKALPGIGTAISVAESVAGLVSGNKGKPTNPSIMTAGGLSGALAAAQSARLTAGPGDGTSIFSPNINVNTLPPMLPMAAGPRGNATQGGYSGPERDPWTPGSGGTPCGRGYHYNKSGYYSQRYGWIPRGTVCVKNRRRNPLNPRALSRAMSRLSSAKNAAKFLGRVSIRERGGCGCK